MKMISKSITVSDSPFRISGTMDPEIPEYNFEFYLAYDSFCKRVVNAFKYLFRAYKYAKVTIDYQFAKDLHRHILDFIDEFEDWHQAGCIAIQRDHYPNGKIDALRVFCECGDDHNVAFVLDEDVVHCTLEIEHWRFLFGSIGYFFGMFEFWNSWGVKFSAEHFIWSITESEIVELFKYVFGKAFLINSIAMGRPVAKEFQKAFLEMIC